MRTISPQFIQSLKFGELSFFLDQARHDPDICMEIRKNYVSIYYKGGCALRIEQHGKGFTFHFDSKYCLNKGNDASAAFFDELNKRDAAAYVEAFPVIRREMDSWFTDHPKVERLFQHNLIKNNQGQLKILDIEFAGRTSARKLFRLDMLGVYKADDGWRLIVFENKFGNGAIGGSAGIAKHYADIVDILSNKESREDLVGSVIEIARIKTELGLLREPSDLKDDMPAEILFVMANFKKESQAIANEVRKMKVSIPAKICFPKEEKLEIDYGQARNLFHEDSDS